MNRRIASRGPQIDSNVCAELIGNKFNLVLIAAARAREIARAHKNAERKDHINPAMDALLEVQSGKLGKEYLRKIR